MGGPARLRQRVLVVGACAAIAGALATTGGADTPAALHQRADALRHANASLAQRSHAALLDLYSLDAKLARAQTQLSTLRGRAAAIARARASAQRHFDVANHDFRVSQRELALRLHALYEQDSTDALAVVLGAQSLDEAITNLDDLNRTAQQNQLVARESYHARRYLRSLTRRLARADVQVRELEAQAERTAAALAATKTAHERYMASLSSQRRLNASQISSLESRAQASAARSATIAAPVAAAVAAAPAAATPSAAPSAGGRTITVSATGYALSGTTASGLPVGPGIVAVDPSVIPLGTHMTIPGYGEGVAADTGSAVQGATIDLWFPSVAQALAWGRRTVTITLH